MNKPMSIFDAKDQANIYAYNLGMRDGRNQTVSRDSMALTDDQKTYYAAGVSDGESEREDEQYIRRYRSQFEFHDLRDMLACVRGQYFAGYASELIAR